MTKENLLNVCKYQNTINANDTCSNTNASVYNLSEDKICAVAYSPVSPISVRDPNTELHPEYISITEMLYSSGNTRSICEVHLNETDTAKLLRLHKSGGNSITQPFIMFTAEGMRTVPGITDVKSYDNKTTVVFFSDGTKEHANCSENDTYSLEYGISVCLLKKLLGGNDTYKKIVNTAAKSYREKQAAEEAEKLRKKEEHEARMQAEKEAARRRKEAEERREKEETEKQISIMAEAFRRAMQQNNEVS